MAKEPAPKLSHLGKGGEARMVDVSGKDATERTAVAEGRVKAVEKGMRIEGIRLLEKQGGKSGHYRAADHPAGKAKE